MKSLDASPDSSSAVWASVCPPPREGKLPKRKQIYSKGFQEMLDKLNTEEEEEVGFGGIGGGGKKRRLSVDQVKALERSFEKENKLKYERKNRLAEDLGLPPRQVAIWFQNRRARWKMKQLERDYDVLKSDYDSLRADYDSLEQVSKSLLSQLMELKMKLQQRVRTAENNLDCECQVVTEEEFPVSELAIVKPEFSYGSDNDDSLVKVSEEENDLNLLKVETDAVIPMCSPMSVSSLNQNNTSTASSGSSCTTTVFSWLQGWDSRAGKAAFSHTQQGMLMRDTGDEQQQLGWLNFFSVDQAPTLHCCFPKDDDNVGNQVSWHVTDKSVTAMRGASE